MSTSYIRRGVISAVVCSAALLGGASLTSAVWADGGVLTAPPVSPIPSLSGQAPAEAAPAGYRLGPEDQIEVSVVNFPNLNCRPAVQPDGTVGVPLLGSVAVTGKTADEVASLLAKRWEKYVIRPSVTVTVFQRRAVLSVTVYGAAKGGGSVPFRKGLRLSQALAAVGGVADEKGDATRVSVIRRSGTRLVTDMSRPETKSGTDADPELEEGDLVFVPEKVVAEVSVLGEVAVPGSLDFKEHTTVLDAITARGGVRETADLAHATLMRAGGKEEPLDLEALLRRGDVSLNRELQPGDRIMVPEIKNRTYIFGAVGRPGYYAYKPGDRLLDALNNSSLMPSANLTQVRLVRIDKDKNTARVTEVNLEKFLKKGDAAGNVALEPGDVIFLTEKGKKFGFQDFLGVLSGLSLVNSAARIFTGGIGN
jgi:polysaccharide export outer membrane protein